MKYRMVLNEGSDDMAASQVADRGGDSSIVTFGTATGKENGTWLYTQDLCHAFTGIFYCQPGFPSIRINGRRITEMFSHIRQHGFQHFFVKSCCSGII